jgi:quinol monooxygenase YgiN
MSITIVATMFPVDGQRAEVIAALEEAIESVHANDEGCELYAMQEGDDRIVMIEKWASQEAIQAHSKSPGLLRLVERLDGKLVTPMDVQLLTPHPAGTAEKGAL